MNSKAIKIGLVARLFASDATYREVDVSPFTVSLKNISLATGSEDLQVASCTVERGFIWSKITLQLLGGGEKTIGGLTGKNVTLMREQVEAHIREIKVLLASLAQKAIGLRDIQSWLQASRAGEHWVANRNLESLRTVLRENDQLLGHPKEIYRACGFESIYEALNTAAGDLAEFRVASNEAFRLRELKRFQNFFDSLVSKPTLEQREASICDEDATLIVASAGSGKTTLLLTKVQYLLEKKYAMPEDILVLAFNRSAKELLEERLYGRTGLDFEIHTFHSFGLRVLAESTGRKPSLSPFAESDVMLGRHIEGHLKTLMSDPMYDDKVRRYFSEYLRPHQSAFDFETRGEYLAHVRGNRPFSFQGEELRSMEELTVANTLFLHGIQYRYEDRYRIDTATKNYRQYQPDFYLPEYDIYIEHFALDEVGRAPAHFKNYLDGVEWKRRTHAANGTVLVETYSYHARKGILAESLLKALVSLGVTPRPLHRDEVTKALLEMGYVSELAITLKTFLHLFKGRGESLASLRSRVQAVDANGRRTMAFLDIFEPVVAMYEKGLRDSRQIDFDDMISKASEAISSNLYPRKFKYLLVDEFQDISLGRAMLLKAIKEKLGIKQLFAVGDDWQAINRFAGGDVGVMTSFEDQYGFSSVFKLTQTFRFNDKVNEVASRFILKNPNQLRKSVKPVRIAHVNQVVLIKPADKSAPTLESILSEIQTDTQFDETKVLVLSRYHYVHEALPIFEYQERFKNLRIIATSIHSAKGQEADYVVVLDLASGTIGKRGSGFPSEAIDDPLFTYLLASSETFDNAEERRLFYVALTRTKGKVFLIADPRNPSKFVEELLTDGYIIEKRGFEKQWDRRCPQCVSSVLSTRSGSRGLFLGCSNFPYCRFTTDFCKTCGTGFLERRGGKYVCDNEACQRSSEVCPDCESGYLVKKDGRYGAFWGCSNFSTEDCRYTRKIRAINS